MQQQEYKGIGIRFGAQLIDWIVLGIVYYLIGFALTGKTSWEISGESAIQVITLDFVIFLLYFSLLEGTAGATIGKMVLKIKVVNEDGNPCGLGAAFIRNILRIIDALPFLYIIGMALISRSPKKQRLGDRVAHTVVVGARTVQVAPPPAYAPAPSAAPSPVPPRPAVEGETRFCTSCGARIPQTAAFCSVCGAAQ